MTILRSVLVGLLVMLAGTIPRNLLFAANLRYFQNVPWAVPLTAAYLWVFWRYLNGFGPPPSTVEDRRASASRKSRSGPHLGVGTACRSTRHRHTRPRPQTCESIGYASPATTPGSFAGAKIHGASSAPHGSSGRWHHRGSIVSWLHARSDRTPPRIDFSDTGHWNCVRGRSPGFHLDPLAVLLGCGRDLWRRHQLHKLNSSGNRAAYRR